MESGHADFRCCYDELKQLADELGLTPTSRASLINILADKTDNVDIVEAMQQFFG